MKTKVFYSLFIAAAFASCTQEVIEAPVNNVQDLSIRPTLGEVVLSEGEGLDSRLAVGTGVRPVFETGDKMGAAIMDAPLYPANPYNEKNPSSNYSIVEYYSSNAGFLKDGNAWYMNSDQPLVEGNYLFYAPYNENLVLRTPFEVRVPQRQNISSEKSALSEYFADKNNVVVIGQKFLASENGVAQRPSVEYYDVMSYPKFTIVNNFDGYLSQFEYNEDGERTGNCNLVDYTGAIKLDSIQLVSKAADPVVIGGLLSNAKVASALNSTKVYPETNANAATWTWKNPLNNHLSQLLNPSATITTESLITTFVAGGLEIAKGEEVSFFAVMPAEKFAKNNLQANVYATIDGKPYLFTVADIALVVANPEEVLLDEEEEEYKAALNAPATKDGWMFKKNSLTFLQGQAYPQEELNYDGTNLTAKSVKGSLLTIKLEGGKYDEEDTAHLVQTLQVAQEVTVDGDDTEDEVITDKIDNNEEFIQFFMDTYSNAEMSEGTKVDVAEGQFAFSTNTTATINSQLIDALSTYQHGGSITINKALSIDNDVKVATIDEVNDKVTFVSATGKTYTITLGTGYDVQANYVLSGENKSLHVKGTYSIASPAVYGNIRNIGTLSVSAKLTVNSLVNDGTLNAEANANIVKPFVNNAGKTVNVNGDNAVMTISNNGIVAATDKTVSLTNVKVTGGEGRYVYTGTEVYTAIKNAEKIAWVNAFKYEGTVDFVTAYEDVSDNKTILENIKDIKKMYIDNVNFATIGTIDMKNIELCITNTSLETISGLDVTQTIVNNLKLNNRTGNQIILNNIAANGTLVAGELYADGYNATWNGDAYGVIALVQDGLEWTVNTEAGLVKLAKLVNDGESTVGVTVTLAKDMDLKNAEFTPIGSTTSVSDTDVKNKWFKGTFDGNGKTIKNLTSKTNYSTGLFGAVYGATIKNVKLENVRVDGHHYAAALVAYAYGVTIENCEVTGAEINCTSSAVGGLDKKGEYIWDGDKAGTLVGHAQYGTNLITNCKASDCTVTAGRDAGQLVGAGYEKDVVNCSVMNVKVSANGTSTGANVNDEIIGRKF